MREWEIGKIIRIAGELYEVCENDNPKGFSLCSDCDLARGGCGTLGLVRCFSSTRSDMKNVIFKKITKDIKDKNMNEKIDLTELLKDCPLETRFYMSVLGEQVKLDSISKTETEHPIVVKTDDDMNFYLSKYGQLFAQYKHGDCVLWPSEECRDWSKFKVPVEKFDYSTLKPFDKVLVRDADRDIWRCNSFTCFDDNQVVCDTRWQQGIPYNEETKHLAGTSDMPDEKYVWWEKQRKE